MSDPAKRKVCVVVASRANYARIKTAMAAVRDHPELELQVVAGASLVLERFGSAVNVMEADGFEADAVARFIIEGESPVTMAKSTGLGLIELPSILEQLAPDIVVTVADRFETIATAIAASYMNIPVAHTQGGEVSGSIDESVRHAITKLSHLHFPATELSARRVIAMGEDPRWVHNVGCPSIDLVAAISPGDRAEVLAPLSARGAGAAIDPSRPFALMMQHPVTTEYGQSFDQINETLDALVAAEIQALVFWPNVDAGSEQIAKGIRLFREKGDAGGFHFFRNLPPEQFARLMCHCDVMIGNSSSALREGAFLGVPAVTIGTRQQNREHGPNVIEAPNDAAAILDAIRTQLAHGRYESNTMFGDGTAGLKIAELLAGDLPEVQKVLNYDPEALPRAASPAEV